MEAPSQEDIVSQFPSLFTRLPTDHGVIRVWHATVALLDSDMDQYSSVVENDRTFKISWDTNGDLERID